ncbi:MAG TPA: CoA transferase [Beijerinckiaceae bacterium]|mgnify:FL=1|nr:CoA transferase [Rhodoblastus sp.]MCC0001403.1 CoA transferase [Methylobacteriaceae bacterium]MCC2109334.1 CoA transferase [Hyphomicrobiales bacterium]HRY05260.1 CoA transferase [Beijerinckiaceae bacterium]MCO5087061.1 CoA transferase [Methylobacteriaceae bacterium]
MKRGALGRFRVIDLTRVRSGPTAVRQLADFGADVIKIEPPDQSPVDGPRHSSDFQNLHRNKRSMTLDLKHPQGLAVFRRLVETADVVVENFRPDVKTRLGIDYEAVRAINPRIVYASISGYGQDGPYRMRPGFDQIAQGMGGLMSITGLPGQGPVRAGIAVADMAAGLYCALGIMTALLEREVSGQGQWVQTSLLQAQIGLLDFQATRWLMDGVVPPQAGNDHPTVYPMGVFPAADGLINIAASGDDMWRKLCDELGLQRIVDDARFADGGRRSRNRAALYEIIAETTSASLAREWIERLNAIGVPCGPIYTIDQVFADPQVQALGIAQSVTHPKLGETTLVGQPVELSRTPGKIEAPTPAHGAHTDDVLRDLGYDAQEIAGMRAAGAL